VRTGQPSKASVRERAESELKAFFFIAAYLLIVFSALAFFKSSILEAQGVYWAPWSFALIKAAIGAKFILIGRKLHIGEGRRTKPLIWQTLHKSIAFLILVAVLTVVEEAIMGFIHGQTFWQSIANIGGGTFEVDATGAGNTGRLERTAQAAWFSRTISALLHVHRMLDRCAFAAS